MNAMPGADPIAPLIPWYANGTLEAAERERVERHLPECPSCYALLARARSFRRSAPGRPETELLEHVEGHLLVQFAEEPDQLDAGTRRFVSTHLSGCGVCAEALEILQDLSHAPLAAGAGAGASPAARGPFAVMAAAAASCWRGLSHTVLRPVPALVYLGALLLVLSVVPFRQPVGDAEVGAGGGEGAAPVAMAVLPPAIRLPEEIIMRGGEERPAPQEIAPPAAAGPFVVELITSIDLDDLADPDAAFRLEIAAGDRVALQDLLRGTDFDRRGRLQLVLDPRALVAGTTYAIRLSLDKEGDPRHGELVYRKSFRLSRPSSS